MYTKENRKQIAADIAGQLTVPLLENIIKKYTSIEKEKYETRQGEVSFINGDVKVHSNNSVTIDAEHISVSKREFSDINLLSSALVEHLTPKQIQLLQEYANAFTEWSSSLDASICKDSEMKMQKTKNDFLTNIKSKG